MEIELKSEITYPNCNYNTMKVMQIEACQYFYKCKNCTTLLKPNQEDCCVYCSFGTVPCTPIREKKLAVKCNNINY